MNFFTADLHLGHEKVIDYCKRPFRNASEMNREIIRRFKTQIKPTDTLWCLGDMSSVRAEEGIRALSQIPGIKILVQGNHDKYSLSQYAKAGFVAVLQEAKIRLNGMSLTLSHYPYWPEHPELEPAHELRFPERRPLDRGGILLCGHVHLLWKQLGRQFNVGVDQWNYMPVSEGSLMSLVMKLPPQTPASLPGTPGT